jgi:hypothetical protein
MRGYSSRELILKMFNGDNVDRVPNFDLLRNKEAVELYGGAKLSGSQEHDLQLVTRACQRVLDATRTIRVPIPSPFYRNELGFVRMYVGWTSWIVEKPFQDYSSFLEWVRTDIRRLEKQLEQWGHGESSFVAEKRRNLDKIQNLLGETVLFWNDAEGWFYEAYNEAGLENFSYLWYDDPVLFSDWIEYRFRIKRFTVEALACGESFPIAFIGEDIASKTGPIFSPRMLENEFFPRLRILVDVFHEKRTKIVFHSDGNLMPVLDQIIATGVDGLHPIEPAAGMELEKVRALCPQNMILIGNLDCSYLLPFGSQYAIEEEVKRILTLARDCGNIIFSSSSELHDEIPLRNIVSMFEAFERYRC